MASFPTSGSVSAPPWLGWGISAFNEWYFQNPPKLKNIGFTEPYQAVGEELRNEKLDAVSAYRRYYQTIKKDIVTWEKKRKMPEWMKKNSGEF